MSRFVSEEGVPEKRSCGHAHDGTGILCDDCRLKNRYATNYAADPKACPRCHGPMENLEGAGFNAAQARRAYRCFRFIADGFECNGEPKW